MEWSAARCPPRRNCTSLADMTSASFALPLSVRLLTERPQPAASASMWRFLETAAPVSLGEGNTPLLQTKSAPAIFIKDEGRNPGGSMLDRVASILVTTAKSTGHKHIAYTGESSTLAASLAAYAAHARLTCSATLSAEADDAEYLRASAAGATLLPSGQNASLEGLLSSKDIALAARVAAHTVACEIAEQLQWNLPETLILPGASPAELLHFEQAFAFLLKHQWTTSAHSPRLLAAHLAPPSQAQDNIPSRIAAQALQKFSAQVALVEEDHVRESLECMAHAGWMLSPAAAAGIAVVRTLPANAAPVVVMEPRSALSAAREIAQLLRIRRYPARMPVGGIISPQ